LRKARQIAELHSGLVAAPQESESLDEYLALNAKATQRIAELRAELADLQSEPAGDSDA
jgi:hypothetical protein